MVAVQPWNRVPYFGEFDEFDNFFEDIYYWVKMCDEISKKNSYQNII